MGQAQQKRRAVLIVEDDAELRRLTAALLEDGNLDTIECESAEAALDDEPDRPPSRAFSLLDLFALGAPNVRPLNGTPSPIQSTPRKGAQRSSPSCAPFPSRGVPTRGRALVTTQGALAAPLQRIDLEWLP
jgi:hypothetical protein